MAIARSLSNSSNVWTLESVQMSFLHFSLASACWHKCTSSFLKGLKAARSNPNNKQQDDDENPTPHSNDSFPVHLELKLPTETGCLC